MINTDRARAFLDRLGWPHTFQTFDDAGKGRRELVRVIHGRRFADVERELTRLNDAGAGIFATINATDGRGRRKENVTSVRALFVDSDGTPAPAAWHRTPDIFVWREAGDAFPLSHWHAYWICNIPLDKFTESQKRLAALYGTDPAVNDVGRVMRIPGFLHRKSEPQELYLERV